ncbi:MAG: tetratricopeptide repeat protein [Thermoguttaceae bacterium]
MGRRPKRAEPPPSLKAGSNKKNAVVPSPREGKPRLADPNSCGLERPGRERAIVASICALLLAAVALVFGQTIQHSFVNYDDYLYVAENQAVVHGLSARAVGWAMTSFYASNWHPLTWLSHLLDCQLYGLDAGWHHLTSVILHAANAVLLFLVLRSMTGNLWPSAFVAAVFAVHPLRAESVAWVAERKDVLSGLFFILTLAAYVGYVRHRFSVGRYAAVIVLYALGLMAKPMLVTLPLVLLLLDYWPLRRLTAGDESPVPLAGRSSMAKRLLVEKIPLFVLSAGSCVMTVLAQRKVVMPLERLSMPERISNALVSYVAYLGQFFLPTGLSPFYPHPVEGFAAWQLAGAVALLAIVSVAAVILWRRAPYFLVGWLWYLGMLVPVIGLLQVGIQSRADRYTYLPQIGLAMVLAWAAVDAARLWPRCRRLCALAAPTAFAALIVLAWCQTAHWHDSEALWNHALDCDPKNVLAHTNLAQQLVARGATAEAIAHFRAAVEGNPGHALAQSSLGVLLLNERKMDEAARHLEIAINLDPTNAQVRVSYGLLLASENRIPEAIAYFRQAIACDPDCAAAHANLGTGLAKLGNLRDAVGEFAKVTELMPASTQARMDLAEALVELGRVEEAIGHYRMAIELAARLPNPALVRDIQARILEVQAKAPTKAQPPKSSSRAPAP